MQECHGYLTGPFCQIYRRHCILHNSPSPKRAAAHDDNSRDATSMAGPSESQAPAASNTPPHPGMVCGMSSSQMWRLTNKTMSHHHFIHYVILS